MKGTEKCLFNKQNAIKMKTYSTEMQSFWTVSSLAKWYILLFLNFQAKKHILWYEYVNMLMRFLVFPERIFYLAYIMWSCNLRGKCKMWSLLKEVNEENLL